MDFVITEFCHPPFCHFLDLPYRPFETRGDSFNSLGRRVGQKTVGDTFVELRVSFDRFVLPEQILNRICGLGEANVMTNQFHATKLVRDN